MSDLFRRVVWAWGLFLFFFRCALIAIADYYIMYIRVGRVWLGKRYRSPSFVQGDLVMQLAPSSPRHSTADEKTIFLQLNHSFIDRRLWAGLNGVGAGPSAVVTGVSQGSIGFFTALSLLLSGVSVHGVVSNGRQAQQIRYQLSRAVERQLMLHKEWSGRTGRLLVHVCDMNDTASVCYLSDTVADDPALRMIICNSDPTCSFSGWLQQQQDQSTVNHVGHYLLMLRLLQNRLQRSRSIAVALPPPWRIVIIASAAGMATTPDGLPTLRAWCCREDAEVSSGLCTERCGLLKSVLLFTFSLARFVQQKRILSETCTVNVVHPGLTLSGVMTDSPPPLQWLWDGEAAALCPITPAIASLYVADLALSRRYECTSGHYFRMGQDQTMFFSDMVSNSRRRAGFIKNSYLFPGIPCPAVSLSLTNQKWVWAETVNYLAALKSIDAHFFALV